MDRGAWQATVHMVAYSWTQLKWISAHTWWQVGSGKQSVKSLSPCFICGNWALRSNGSPCTTCISILKVADQIIKLLMKMFYLPTLTKYLHKDTERPGSLLGFLDFLELARRWQYLASTPKAQGLDLYLCHPAIHPSLPSFVLSCSMRAWLAKCGNPWLHLQTPIPITISKNHVK